jgi:hypothetical protein
VGGNLLMFAIRAWNPPVEQLKGGPESDHRFNRAWVKHAARQDFADHACTRVFTVRCV